MGGQALIKTPGGETMQSKYDRIGRNYDTSRSADPFLLSRLINHLGLSKEKYYLDAACGSGNYTTTMANEGGKWFGVDLSEVMLSKARSKSSLPQWIKASVECLPFENHVFDGISCTLAIHHFGSLIKVFSEFHRVLREGRFVLFTSTTEQMRGYWLREYFPVAMERSSEQMPGRDKILSALLDAGLEPVEVEPYFIKPDLSDFFLYSGKHRPEIYLDPRVRRGISTFSSLADEEEILSGCSRLAADIESGKIKEVISGYENDLGDYCFIVSEQK
jgi:ubiquinone/menaquinone biosynthesis C-methylase UbiE